MGAGETEAKINRKPGRGRGGQSNKPEQETQDRQVDEAGSLYGRDDQGEASADADADSADAGRSSDAGRADDKARSCDGRDTHGDARADADKADASRVTEEGTTRSWRTKDKAGFDREGETLIWEPRTASQDVEDIVRQQTKQRTNTQAQQERNG